MALPNNFSDSEFLQDVFRKVRNQQVREWFSDVGGENWEPNLNSTRAQYRVACTHKEGDSALETLLRIELFKDLQKPERQEVTVFGHPTDELDVEVTYRPQILLYFSQPSIDVAPDESFTKARLTLRLINETKSTLTPSKIEALARKINSIFGQNNGYRWKKGYYSLTYWDKANGYRLKVLAYNRQEGKRVIRDALSIQNHTPDWTKLNIVISEDAEKRFPTNPGEETILGKQVRKPRRRPRVYVRFRYSALKIHNFPTINLVDLTGIRHNPLISA